MWKDPVVEKVRKRRTAILKRLDFNLDAVGEMLEGLNRRFLPPKPPKIREKKAA